MSSSMLTDQQHTSMNTEHNYTNEQWQIVQKHKKNAKPQRYHFRYIFNDEEKSVLLTLIDSKTNTELIFRFESPPNTEAMYTKLYTVWHTIIKPSGFVNPEYKMIISDKYLVSNDELNVKFIKRETNFGTNGVILSISFGVNNHVSTYSKL